MAAALFAINAIGPLAGHPVYHPIYEAAAEVGLPIVFHRGLDALPDMPTSIAGGAPGSFAEYMTMSPAAVINQLMSLITHGALPKYPDLRVYLVGAGVSWIPGVLRRMELMMRSLRREIPWVREEPTEYFERQVRVSTYGIELGAPAALERLFASHPGLADVLCYGSGYPSWDTAAPADVSDVLPAEWHDRVFHDNAAEWFRWGGAAPAPVYASGGATA
jgi:predicted TIM-barrel fold metal-dependent hydrolase